LRFLVFFVKKTKKKPRYYNPFLQPWFKHKIYGGHRGAATNAAKLVFKNIYVSKRNASRNGEK